MTLQKHCAIYYALTGQEFFFSTTLIFQYLPSYSSWIDQPTEFQDYLGNITITVFSLSHNLKVILLCIHMHSDVLVQRHPSFQLLYTRVLLVNNVFSLSRIFSVTCIFKQSDYQKSRIFQHPAHLGVPLRDQKLIGTGNKLQEAGLYWC